MNIREILSDVKKNNVPRLECELLLAFVLSERREYLYSHDGRELSDVESEKFQELLQKLQNGYPLAYIIHEKEFYGRNFFVDERVLIPRPETEEMVEEVFSFVRSFACSKLRNHETAKLRILDLGTGSGCIPITLFLEGFTHVCASDISPEALEVAQLNAQRWSTSVEFRQGDLLKPWGNDEIDILIANLPYVEEGLVVGGLLTVENTNNYLETTNYRPQTTDLSSDLKYEPSLALFAGNDGLDVYRELLSQLKKRKQLPELFMFEAGMENTSCLCELCKEALPNISWEVKRDLGGKERFVIGKK